MRFDLKALKIVMILGIARRKTEVGSTKLEEELQFAVAVVS